MPVVLSLKFKFKLQNLTSVMNYSFASQFVRPFPAAVEPCDHWFEEQQLLHFPHRFLGQVQHMQPINVNF